MQKGRFYARGTACVVDIDAQEAGRKQFVGRKFQKVDEGHAFVPKSEPAEVRLHPEYVRDCREGALWPADQATADACGVRFDPSFGGELPSETKATVKAASKESV